MKAFVTGGAGFIGSNLVARLLAEGAAVTAYDDLSLGKRAFLAPFVRNKQFRFVEADITADRHLAARLRGHDIVFHLQANSDIPRGLSDTSRDLRLSTIATQRLLEAMRRCGTRRIVFASTSAIYGEARERPTPEDYGPLFPISLYGAGKLAAESLITAFVHCFGIQAWIYRFSNICGRNGTHGVMVDLIRQIRRRPRQIRVLGDGRQAKPYLHVDECIGGMLFGLAHARDAVNGVNLTPRGATSVRTIVGMIVKRMGVGHLPIRYTGGKRGWAGDVPQVELDGRRMARLGWKPLLSSDDAVEKAIDELVTQMGRA